MFEAIEYSRTLNSVILHQGVSRAKGTPRVTPFIAYPGNGPVSSESPQLQTPDSVNCFFKQWLQGRSSNGQAEGMPWPR